MSTPLIKEFNYKTPVHKVWLALTDTQQMKRWYFPQLQKFEPIVGFEFQFEDSGAAYQKEWIVTKVTEGKTLAHSWTYKGYTGNSEVTFDLFAEGDSTRLRITQTNLDSFPDHPHFSKQRFEDGWDTLLGQNLKYLLEHTGS
ncbi:MAG: SRPBCC domain-containing protein [Bacteroidota bacterium]